MPSPPRAEHSSPAPMRVRVSCRVRPALPTESTRCCTEITSVGGCRALQLNDPRGGKGSTVYKFDGLYTAASTQEDIFETEVSPLIQRAIKGHHGTVFAYGVTGSGKTHTMIGSPSQEGILIRSVKRILLQLSEKNKSSCFRLWEDTNADGSEPTLDVSFFEMYNNQCFDLFDSKQSELQIKDDGSAPAVIADLTKMRVKSAEDFQQTFDSVQAARSSAGTAHDRSSRSHAVLTLHLSYTEDGKTFCGKLNLIDLAGQEDQRKSSGAQGARMAESSSITSSLFCLGKVLNAINNNSARVPYRDSKLTRVLQDSLGGPSEAAMLICVAPHPKFYQDTLSTLTYACKARGASNAAAEQQDESENNPASANSHACGGVLGGSSSSSVRAGGAASSRGGGGGAQGGRSFAAMVSGAAGGGALRDWKKVGADAGRKRKGGGGGGGAGEGADARGGEKRGKAQHVVVKTEGGFVKTEGGGWGAGVSAEDIVGGKQSELVCEFLRQSEALQLDAVHHQKMEDSDSVLQDRFFTPRRGAGPGAGCSPSPWAPLTPLSQLLGVDSGVLGLACSESAICDRLISTPRLRTPLAMRDPNAAERSLLFGASCPTPGSGLGKGPQMLRRAACLEAEGRVEEALAVMQELLDALPDHPGRAAVVARVQAKMAELGSGLEMGGGGDEGMGMSVEGLLSPGLERAVCGGGEDGGLRLSSVGPSEGEDSLFGDLANLGGSPLRCIMSPGRPATTAPPPPPPPRAAAAASAPVPIHATSTTTAAKSSGHSAAARRANKEGKMAMGGMGMGMGMSMGMAMGMAGGMGGYPPRGMMPGPALFGVGPCGMANAVVHRQLVDMLNTSTYARLCHLRGIGKQRAKKLVELRGAPEMGLGPPISHLDELKTIGMTSKQIDKFFMDNAPQMLFQPHR